LITFIHLGSSLRIHGVLRALLFNCHGVLRKGNATSTFSVILGLTLLYCFPLPRILEDLKHDSHFISYARTVLWYMKGRYGGTQFFFQYFFPVI